MIESHPAHHPGEEISSLRTSVQQRNREIRAIDSEHKPWNTAPSTEVNHRARYPVQGRHEGPSVLNDLHYGPIAQKAEALGNSQRLV
jgi:hypothetical protein